MSTMLDGRSDSSSARRAGTRGQSDTCKESNNFPQRNTSKRQGVVSSLANWSPKLENETFVLESLSRAFSAWSEYSPLVFRRTINQRKADITIAFGRYHHGDR